jgi:RNA recognition motif-containing protein
VVYDRETGRSRGFGFVAFTEEASASSAVQSMDQVALSHPHLANLAFSNAHARGASD